MRRLMNNVALRQSDVEGVNKETAACVGALEKL